MVVAKLLLISNISTVILKDNLARKPSDVARDQELKKLLINDGNLLGIRLHYNQAKYKGQKIFYVRITDQVYVVPYEKEDDGTIFLKTLYPSRKAKKKNF